MSEKDFSAEQCRAARGLLNLSQAELAQSAHLTDSTVARFEQRGHIPTFNNLQAIRSALEAAGAVFVSGNGGGPGVRVSKGFDDGADDDTVLSPALCRAARDLLNLSQFDLAGAAGLGRSTVADYERGARRPNPENLAALRAALESAGAVFIPAGKTAGPGVRLKI